MGLDGPSFYDDEQAFATYMRRRLGDETPNDALEKPDLLELIGSAAGPRVLDRGYHRSPDMDRRLTKMDCRTRAPESSPLAR